MAINKNFVVKNGLEVNTNLIFADTNLNKVGIGTTIPNNNLQVFGGIGASSIVATSGTITSISGTNINYTGVSTLTNLKGTNIYYSGISTFSGVEISSSGIEISSGIITASSGIVTYYGDGKYLDLSSNTTGGFGIGTTQGVLGYGVTFVNFFGAGVSTTFYNSSAGIATIFFEGGGTGTIGIGSTFPGTPASTDAAPSNGDLFYNINYGRTFIYYDEVALGIGSTAVWVDASPFNQSILTSLAGIAFSTGSAISPSWYFLGDTQTGVFSPSSGELTVVSSGSSILNVDISGIDVTGLINGSAVSINGTQVLSNSRQLQNISSLDATTTATIESAIVAAPNNFSNLNVSGVSTLGHSSGIGSIRVGFGSTTLIVDGDTRITGILTIGTSSITLNGSSNTINVGSGVTINGSANRINLGTGLTLNSSGIIAAGIITSSGFVGNLTGTASTATASATAYGLTGTISGSNLTNLNASNLSSGTVPTARLASGTANASTFLRGDQTWALVNTDITISDDTSTNAERYLTFTNTTSGTINTQNVSSTNLTFNPSTGTLTVIDLNSTSDANLKTNIKTVENALDTVEQLRGVSFDWKETGKGSYGVIAQELEEILPELVGISKNKSVNYNGLIGVLIEAVKELSLEVRELKSQINN